MRVRNEKSEAAAGSGVPAPDVNRRVVAAMRRLSQVSPPMERALYTVDERELTRAQMDALVQLMARPSWRMQEIAAELGVDPSTASRTIAPLVDLGLSERNTDPADRRTVVVRTTPKGQAIGTRVAKDRHELMQKVMGHLPAARRSLLAELLEEFANANEAVLREIESPR